MVTRPGKTPRTPIANPEEVAQKLKATISSLKTNLAIYDNDMKRELERLRTQYGINSIEEGIQEVEKLDALLDQKNNELDNITNKISVAMEKYSG
jgi:hypothetical protein